MNRSQQFVNLKKSEIISKCSSFDMIVEGFAELKAEKSFQSEKIKFLDSDDEWWISIVRRPNSIENTWLTFFLKASDCFLKSWSCSVSGTINGERFETHKECIYRKDMSIQHCCAIHQKKGSLLKLRLTMKISENEDLMVTKQKFIDTTRQHKQIISNNESILREATYSDFTFIIEEQKFKVHKSILAAASPVFHKLFQSEFSETATNECRVTDIEPQIFQFLLDFIYGDKLPPQLHEDKLSRKLFEAAHYYQIKGLVDICTSVEHYKLTKDNAVDMYEWADTYGLENLKINAWKIIQFDILEIFDQKQPPSICTIRLLIEAKEEKDAFMEECRLKISKLGIMAKDLLK